MALAAVAALGGIGARDALAGGASTRPGVGAVIYSAAGQSGVTFRTWAPFAGSVSVAGSFNFWNINATPMAPEGNGWWSTDVPQVGAGAQYKFVIRNGSSTLWKNDPRARRVTNSVGNSIVYDPNAYQWQTTSWQMPSWDGLVMYEMHPGTFGANPGQSPPATLQACRAKLDHLESLGVNAIALMPVNEFPGDRSWGYNASHPWTVETAYGGPDALKAFVDDAHSRGIAVLNDVVYNHFGPTDLDLWRFDGWSQNGGGGIFFYNDSRAQTPWGDTRPDYGRPEVRDYLRENLVLWLTEFRMDGTRVDATKFIRRVGISGPEIPDGWWVLQQLNDAANQLGGGKIMVAEDLDTDAWITRPTSSGGAGFDSQWCSGFYPKMRPALVTPNDADRNMWDVRDAIALSYNGNWLQRIVYTESHDEVANGRSRIPEEISPGNAGSWWARKRSTLGAGVVFATPGIPMIFQGQEFLEDEWFRDDVALDWTRAQTYSGILQLYRDLIALRRNSSDLTRGLRGASTNVFHVNNLNKVIAWHRWQWGGERDDTVIVCNFSATPLTNYRIGMPRPGLWRVRLNSDWSGYSSDYANHPCFDTSTSQVAWDGLSQSALVSLGAYSIAIFSQGAPTRPEDLNSDGRIDALDLSVLLANWGGAGSGDLDGNGRVDGIDLSRLLAAWGS
jgi:1,4-alpha-glucan branching enzyme